MLFNVNKNDLAALFTSKIGVCAAYHPALCPIETQIVDTLIVLFPWLSRFHIERDGNDLRWRTWDGEVEDSAIVFTTVEEAGEQVRRWVVEYMERAETTD